MIISEIMYATNSDNPLDAGGPDGEPGFDEWVEIVNVSGAPVDLSGWYLEDEDGRTTGLPAGATLAPGEAAVIFGADRQGANFVNFESVAEFYASWGCGYQAFPVEGWFTDFVIDGINRLGDSGEAGTASDPSTGREILQLRDGDNNPIDVVNYDNDGFNWPLPPQTGNPNLNHLSIFVFSTAFLNEEDNDSGLSWGTVPAPFFGAVNNDTMTTLYNGQMAGSPGFVDGFTSPLDPNLCLSPEACRPDLNNDGLVDLADITAFVTEFDGGGATVDFVKDFGTLDLADISAFVTFFLAGCE